VLRHRPGFTDKLEPEFICASTPGHLIKIRFAMDDFSGNQLFRVGVNGALGGTVTVGALPAASGGK